MSTLTKTEQSPEDLRTLKKSSQNLQTQTHTSTKNLTPIQLYQKRRELTRIHSLSKPDIAKGIAVIFSKNLVFNGFKEDIDQFNKQDLMKMISSRYHHLSLEEIDMAFEMDRYGHFGPPTKHYHLFNAEYVTTVLLKYENWLEIRNRTVPVEVKERPELTEFEIKQLEDRKLRDEFNSFFETRKVNRLKNNYTLLYKRGLLPDHTPEFISEVEGVILSRLEKRAMELKDLIPINTEEYNEKKEVLSKLEAVRSGKEKVNRNDCREYILENFYNNLIDQKTHISQLYN